MFSGRLLLVHVTEATNDTPSYAGVFNSIFNKCKKTPQIAYSCNDYILQGKLISLGLGVSARSMNFSSIICSTDMCPVWASGCDDETARQISSVIRRCALSGIS